MEIRTNDEIGVRRTNSIRMRNCLYCSDCLGNESSVNDLNKYYKIETCTFINAFSMLYDIPHFISNIEYSYSYRQSALFHSYDSYTTAVYASSNKHWHFLSLHLCIVDKIHILINADFV